MEFNLNPRYFLEPIIKILKSDKTIYFLGAILFFLGYNYGFNIYDEGIGIVNAWRISYGDIPYRDFWTVYPPFNAYFFSFILNIFGWSVLSTRIISGFISILSSFLIYKISLKLLTKAQSFLLYFLTIVILSAIPLCLKSINIAILLSLSSIYLLIRYFDFRKFYFLIFSSVLLAFVFYTRHDVAVFLLFSSLCSLIMDKYISEKIIFSRELFIFISIPVVSMLGYVYFGFVVGWNNLFDQLLGFQMNIYKDYRHLNYPLPFTFIGTFNQILQSNWLGFVFYFPIITFVLSIGSLVRINPKEYKTKWLLLFSLTLFGMFLFILAGNRADAEHLLPSLIISLPILLVVISLYFYKNRKLILIFLLSIIMIFPFLKKMKSMDEAYLTPHSVYIENYRTSGISLQYPWGSDLEKSIEFVKENTKKDEKIFVSSGRHDMILHNDVAFYFLSDRKPATKYHELHPGIVTTEPIQNTIISELKRNNVKLIVKFIAINNFNEPNKSCISSGVYLLDNYINQNYSLVKKYGHFEIMKKKSI